MPDVARPRARLVFFSGLAELLIFRAALREGGHDGSLENIGVFYGWSVSIPPALRRQVNDLACRVFGLDEMRDIRDIAGADTLRARWSGREELIEAVAARFSTHRIEEIWLNALTKPYEKFVLGSLCEGRLYLFDNGVFSHLPAPVRERPRVQELTYETLAADEAVREHVARVERAYFTVGDLLPMPDYLPEARRRVLSRESLVAAVADLRDMVPIPADAGDGPAALLIGSSLYRTRVISHDEERRLYVRLARSLASQGYRVIWKEHPRVGDPFFPALEESARGSVSALVDQQGLPVEAVVGDDRCELSVSLHSTALLSLQKLFRIRGYLVEGECSNRLRASVASVRFLYEHWSPRYPDSEPRHGSG